MKIPNILAANKDAMLAYYWEQTSVLFTAVTAVADDPASFGSKDVMALINRLRYRHEEAGNHWQAITAYFSPLPDKPSQTNADRERIKTEQMYAAYNAYLTYEAATSTKEKHP